MHETKPSTIQVELKEWLEGAFTMLKVAYGILSLILTFVYAITLTHFTQLDRPLITEEKWFLGVGACVAVSWILWFAWKTTAPIPDDEA